MTRVKICGIKEVAHAMVAAEAGADFIGMVFAASRRQIAPEHGRAIMDAVKERGASPMMVGVFVNQEPEFVNTVARTCSLDWVELSGDETLEYCEAIRFPILKVVHVPTQGAPEELLPSLRRTLEQVHKKRHLPMLDSASDVAGGSGKSFNWEIARELAKEFDFMLAGGLTLDNVAQAISTARPWAVDVSSGVETGGIKDPEKIRAFVKAAREAEALLRTPNPNAEKWGSNPPVCPFSEGGD